MAIVIGTSRYQDPDLQILPTVEGDAHQLANVLMDSHFEVHTLLNPRLRDVMKAFSAVDRGMPKVLLIFLAGHGIRDRSGDQYVLLADSDRQHPRATALSLDDIRQYAENSGAGSIVVLLDVCQAGRAIAPLGQDGWHPSFSLLSSSYAYGSSEPRLSHVAAEGLRTGVADSNRDGKVDSNELLRYAGRELAAAGHAAGTTLLLSPLAETVSIATVDAVQARAGADVVVRPIRMDLAGDGGYRLTWNHALRDLLMIEVHADQYSINWQTGLGPTDFVKLMTVDKNQVTVCFSTGEPVTMYAFQARELASHDEFADSNPQLIRYWLNDSSVVWQRAQSEMAIVGIGSNRIDPGAIAKLLWHSASPEIRQHLASAVDAMQELRHLRFSRLPLLRNALSGISDD